MTTTKTTTRTIDGDKDDDDGVTSLATESLVPRVSRGTGKKETAKYVRERRVEFAVGLCMPVSVSSIYVAKSNETRAMPEIRMLSLGQAFGTALLPPHLSRKQKTDFEAGKIKFGTRC